MENFKKHGMWYVLGILFLAVGFIWLAVFTEERGEILTVAFLDVGQGDAIFVEAPNGNQVLIDGGSGKEVLRELAKVMPFYDHSIDVIIATHPDTDHIGGLSDVLERFDVDYIFEPGVESDTTVYKAFASYVADEVRGGAIHTFARRGQLIVLDDEVYLHVLFPDRDVHGMESNASSVIVRLVYSDTEFLFTGDSPQMIEKYLTYLDGGTLQSDVLKVGHHGSRTSSAGSFLAAVLPTYAVISASMDNSYGHPHEEVLNTLNTLEVTVLGTYDRGTILFETDGEFITVR